MKNSYLITTSFLLTIFIIYIILFFYTFFNLNNEFNYAFKSLKTLNFHKKYSKKIHHIRDESSLDFLFKNPKVEDLLFTTINSLDGKEKIVLFQGDSWMEQITFPVDDNFISAELVQKFKNKKKVGFINAGTSSYSPSIMNLQLDVLEEEFQIFPNIIIAYIDQTDIGDENCRYKYNKIYENDVLISVQPELHLMYKDLFNYSQIYGLSEIFLNEKNKILKTFKLVNFKFKYGLKKSGIRFFRKYISRSEIDKSRLKKCYGEEILSNLVNPKDSEIKYFANTIKEYIKKVNQKKHVEKIFIVTAPHKKHFDKNFIEGISYKLNVSDIIDSILQENKNVTHINFSKILLNNDNLNNEDIWLDDNMHFNSNFHGNFFIKKILDELSKYLNTT